MDYALPVLISVFVTVVLFRRQIKAASRNWFEAETTTQKETLADIVSRERKKLSDRAALEAALDESDAASVPRYRRRIGGGEVD